MKLCLEALQDKAAWEAVGVRLPQFDVQEMRAQTAETPVWVHFGAGNIFRGFVAMLQQRLLNEGEATCGIIAGDTFDYDIVKKIYKPHDELTMMVGLKPDGSTEREIVASIADSVCADSTDAAEMQDAELKTLIEHISYDEGMPVVTDPGIIKPADFIAEVVGQRFPNPFIPDTPQRIATDTSQKIPIHFGETIKSYIASGVG